MHSSLILGNDQSKTNYDNDDDDDDDAVSIIQVAAQRRTEAVFGLQATLIRG